MKLAKRLLFYIFIISSIAANLVFFLSDGLTYLRIRELRQKQNTEFPKVESIKEFCEQIFNENLKILETGKRPDVPNFPEGVIDRIKYNLNIGQPHYPFFEGGEPNWVMVATLEDAIRRNDKESIKILEKVFEERILNVELTEVDCALSGGTAILLHRYTKEQQYRDYADNVYKWLRAKDTEYGILYRDNGLFQLNDGYGMYIPFLTMYSKEYNDSTAQNLADKQMEIAAKYLMDSVSGIPVHGFTLNSNHSKIMHSNFGRGISWFVSGLIDYDTTNLSDECKESISRLDSTLCNIWKEDKCFSQFPGQGGSIDLSAELPILYYLYHKELVSLSKEQLLRYSEMADNGLLYHSSGSVTSTYSNYTGTNILAQAFMLKLLNEIKD